jgi:hypothetical protein
MLEKTGKAAVIHPTGTGKSFIGFQYAADHPEMKVLWLAPSEYIFKTQMENWFSAGGDELKNVTFLTYAKLSIMPEEEIIKIVEEPNGSGSSTKRTSSEVNEPCRALRSFDKLRMTTRGRGERYEACEDARMPPSFWKRRKDFCDG